MSASDDMPESCWVCGQPFRLKSIEPHITNPDLTLHNFECAAGHHKTKLVKRCRGDEGD